MEGRILLNGQPVSGRLSNSYISYVAQEDVFEPTLSAWESLLFVTQLCMEAQPDQTRNARMNEVLDMMGLLKVKHSKVSNLP